MAHNITQTEGTAHFADSRVSANGMVDAWHKLGTPVGHTMTADEALDAAHMKGWDVRKVPLRANIAAEDADPLYTDIPGKYVSVRTNPINGRTEPLGVVGRLWTPFQNEATTELLYNITDQSGAHIETIGALGEFGQRTFVTMKMPQHVELTTPSGTKDTTEMYLSIFNHHDGGGSLAANISGVRVVCANTQKMAEDAAVSDVRIRHTGEQAIRLEEVRRMLGLTWKYIDVFQTKMDRLADIGLENVEVFDIMRQVFEVDKVADDSRARQARIQQATEAFTIYKTSDTIGEWRGSAFGAYNAVTEWVDHHMPVKAKENQATARALRTIAGGGSEFKARAFTALLPA